MKEKFASISQLLHEFNMQTVEEGGENAGTTAGKEEKVYNFADFSDGDIKEKFASAKTIDINASEFRILGSLGEGGFTCVFRYGSFQR